MSRSRKLRWLLLAVCALAAGLVVVALGAVRIYQNELVHRAESELVAQGAMIQANYKRLLLEQLEIGPTPESGSPPPPLEEYAVSADVDWNKKIKNWLKPESFHFGLYPRRVHGEPPNAHDATEPPDPQAAQAGERLEPQLRDAGRLHRATVQVVDFKGTVVASTVRNRGRSLLHRDEVSRALHGEFVQMLRRRPTRRTSAASGPRPVGADVDVCVGIPIVHEGRLLGAVVLSKAPVSVSTALWKSPSLAWGLFAVLVALAALLGGTWYVVWERDAPGEREDATPTQSST